MCLHCSVQWGREVAIVAQNARDINSVTGFSMELDGLSENRSINSILSNFFNNIYPHIRFTIDSMVLDSFKVTKKKMNGEEVVLACVGDSLSEEVLDGSKTE